MNASVCESPRSGSTAVVDGATALASIVPAECGPLSSISHIWYTVPGCGGATLFITNTPAFFSRENTTVAVPPVGMSAEHGPHIGGGEHLLGGRRGGRRPQRQPDAKRAEPDHQRGRGGQQRPSASV